MGHVSGGELAAMTAVVLGVSALKLAVIGGVVYFAMRLALRSRRT